MKNAIRKSGEVHSIEFKPAKGGLISSTHLRFKRGGQGSGPDYDNETEMAVHPTIEHAAAHLKTRFGRTFKSEPAAEEQSSEE